MLYYKPQTPKGASTQIKNRIFQKLKIVPKAKSMVPL
jgi:hypothetical protein